MALDCSSSMEISNASIVAPNDDQTPTSAMPPLTMTDQIRLTPSTDLSMVKAVPPFNEADTRAIIRQVEFYFSDQNLPSDAHLLGRTGGDGNGATSLSEICGFKKMRGFKPRGAIKDVLRHSAVLDLVHNGKSIKRRFLLTVKLRVQPRIDLEREHVDKTLADNPHLTKNFIKPTGFEAGFADCPITPREHEKNIRLYDPAYSFWLRIENALAHYRSKRKMHQRTLNVFNLWMDYGGISQASTAFSSGHKDYNPEDVDKEEVAMLNSQYTVNELVMLEEENWVVDFEGTAIGFLSTEFLSRFDWDMPGQIQNVCGVMKNFFNFLLHHDVCPEYAQQLLAARHAVDKAEAELYALQKADKQLRHPHSFNAACTIEFVSKSTLRPIDNPAWNDVPLSAEEEAILSCEQAFNIIAAGVAAFGDAAQVQAVVETHTSECKISPPQQQMSTTVATMGLEITAIELAEGSQAQFFAHLEETIVPRMGLMHCKRWFRPYEPLYDAPKTPSAMPTTFSFIMNESALHLCSIGMKFDALVRMTASGLCWIHELYNVHPSYYLWLPNTRMKEIKQRSKVWDEVDEFLKNNPGWVHDENGVYKKGWPTCSTRLS